MVAWVCLGCRSSSSVFLSYSLAPTTPKPNASTIVCRARVWGKCKELAKRFCETFERAGLKLSLGCCSAGCGQNRGDSSVLDFDRGPATRDKLQSHPDPMTSCSASRFVRSPPQCQERAARRRAWDNGELGRMVRPGPPLESTGWLRRHVVLSFC